MPLAVTPYSHADAAEWDKLIENSTSGTFLHTRRFLAYHRDRFIDMSVCIRDGAELIGVLPAASVNRNDSRVVSHPGLSYGGLIHGGKLCGQDMLAVWGPVLKYYSARGFKSLCYKIVPTIYQRAPAQDDVYAIFRHSGRRYRCDLSVAIDLRLRLKVSGRRTRGLKKAVKTGVLVTQDPRYVTELWAVLERNLGEKHEAKPTHSLDEIRYLHQQFPDNIFFLSAILNGSLIGGVVLFFTPTVLHAQYICSNELGKSVCALDLIFAKAIEMASSRDLRYFNFGICSEDNGNILNEGLYRFKSEFGGAGVVHEFYEIST
jgi:Acetyltransferase (GNAT) domain